MTVLQRVAATVLVATACWGQAQTYWEAPEWQQASIQAASPPLVADFNGDTRADLFFTGYANGVVNTVCLLADPMGGFLAPIVTPLNLTWVNAPWLLGAADLEPDGDLDVVVFAPVGIVTLFGDGAGGLTNSSPVVGTAGGNGAIYSSFTVVDLDNDGIPEIAGAINGWTPTPPHTVTIWTFLSGFWIPAQVISVNGYVYELASGDFNGDGWSDIIAVPPAINVPTAWDKAHVLVNQGGPGFTFSVTGPFTHGASSLSAVADVDGDGCSDMVTWSTTSSVVISRGSPQSVLQPAVASLFLNTHSVAATPPQLEDIDGDGLRDLIISTIQPVPMLGGGPALMFSDIYLARAGGLFESPMTVNFGPTGIGRGITAADLDGDGDPDLVGVRSMTLGSPAGQLGNYDFAIAWNQAILGPGTGPPLSMGVGTAAPGNGGFTLSLSGAPALAPAALGLSLGTVLFGSPVTGIWLDLSPGQLLLPSGLAGAALTDATGVAGFTFAIPNVPWLSGQALYGQWVVADPQGIFPIGGSLFSLTEARKIVIW